MSEVRETFKSAVPTNTYLGQTINASALAETHSGIIATHWKSLNR